MITFSNLWFLFVGGGLVALVAMAFVSRARRGRLLAAFLGGSRAARRLSGRDLLRLQFERIVLLGLASMAIATAAAGPRETSSEGEPKAAEPSQLRRVMVAIDVSSSMQDTDVSPTRVGAAARIAETLVESLEGAEVGLLLVAGKAYTLAPPTDDHRGLLYMLSGVTPTTTTPWDSGSRLSAGIREGVVQLAGTDSVPQEGVIVVISDAAMSEPDEDAIAAVRGAVASGIEVHTIGVGSRGPGEGAASDRNGAGGATEFREPLLRRLAQIGGGTYTDGMAGSTPVGPSAPVVGFSRANGGAPWNDGDLTFWLTSVALLLLLADGLLDGEVRIGWREPPRSAL